MARSALIPSINPAPSFHHHFPQPISSFILPYFLRIRRCGISGGNRRRGITMAIGKDHYSTLKINRNATLQEIKSAYRKLAPITQIQLKDRKKIERRKVKNEQSRRRASELKQQSLRFDD